MKQISKPIIGIYIGLLTKVILRRNFYTQVYLWTIQKGRSLTEQDKFNLKKSTDLMYKQETKYKNIKLNQIKVREATMDLIQNQCFAAKFLFLLKSNCKK